MPAVSTEREALKEDIEPIVRAFDYNHPNPPFPSAIVGLPTDYDPNDTNSDTATLTIPVSLYVPFGASRSAEDALEELIVPVVEVIEAESERAVRRIRDFGVLENRDGQPVALGCVLEVLIYA